MVIAIKLLKLTEACMYESVNWIIFDLGNGLPPAWRQATTWTNADLLSIETYLTDCNEIWIKIW